MLLVQLDMYQAELKFVSADIYFSSIILITDIDECSDGSDDCDDNALCENTEGSHTCTCNQCSVVQNYSDSVRSNVCV